MAVVSVIWALINVVLLVFLLRFWLNGFTLIPAQYGRWGTGVMFLLTLSMCVRPTADGQLSKATTFKMAVNRILLNDLRTSQLHSVQLLDLPFTTITERCTLTSQPNDSLNGTFQTTQSGLTGYLRWERLTESVGLSPNQHFLHYETTGILTWYLLGIPLYRQNQLFSGDITLQPQTHRPGVHVGALPIPEQVRRLVANK